MIVHTELHTRGDWRYTLVGKYDHGWAGGEDVAGDISPWGGTTARVERCCLLSR